VSGSFIIYKGESAVQNVIRGHHRTQRKQRREGKAGTLHSPAGGRERRSRRGGTAEHTTIHTGHSSAPRCGICPHLVPGRKRVGVAGQRGDIHSSMASIVACPSEVQDRPHRPGSVYRTDQRRSERPRITIRNGPEGRDGSLRRLPTNHRRSAGGVVAIFCRGTTHRSCA